MGISPTEDGQDMKYYTKEIFKKDDGVTKMNSSDFFVFYPIRKQCVVGMGENKRNRMTKQTQPEPIYTIESTLEFNPVKISCSRNSTFLLAEGGLLYSTGDKYGHHHEEFTLMKMPEKTQPPQKVFCGRKCKFVITEDGKTYFMGEEVDSELAVDSPQKEFAEFKLTKDESNTEKIVDIACGIWYNLFVTDQGKLWASGRNMLKRLKIDSKEVQPIPLS